jgi:hypothetical protein
VQQRVVQGRLRPSQGEPPWLPAGSDAAITARERKAYRTDEVGRVMVETGLFETGEGFLFVCPMCGHEFRNDQRLEPLCTGPSWTNDHEPTIMIEVRS